MVIRGKYSILERLNLDAVYNRFLGLPPDRQTIMLVVVGLVLLFVILLPISLASSKISRMERNLRENRAAMGRIVDVIDNYNAMSRRYATMKTALETGYVEQLKSTIAELAEKAGVTIDNYGRETKDEVRSELLSESYMDIRPDKSTLPQIIDFLYSIEYAPNKVLRVNEFSMKKRFDDPKLFDISKMKVSTFKIVQETKEKGRKPVPARRR